MHSTKYISHCTCTMHVYVCVSLHSLHAVLSVEWLVLDEADKLFEDGPNNTGFREQVSFPYASFAATPVIYML